MKKQGKPDGRPRSLVTGGAGFIGSHVVDALLELDHQVVVLDDCSGGFRDNVHPAARLITGSVADPALVEQIFSTESIDYVYHLAAYAAEGLSHFIRRFNYTNNVIGSVNLINAAIRHQCKCFVFTSSIAVYGAGQTPMREDLTPRPEDPYGIAKYAVELDLAAARHMFGLQSIVFRPHNVYGERQNIGDPYRNVVGIFMNQIMQGLPCTIFGDGTQQRAFTHISDVAPLIAKSVYNRHAYGEIFNIGADQPYSVNMLAEMVQQAMGNHTGVVRLPPRKEVQHAFSDHSKLQQTFGYVAKVGLERGLESMARWVRSVGVRQAKAFTAIEVERNLPESWSRLCIKASQSA